MFLATASVLLAHDLFLKLETYFVPPQTAVPGKWYVKFIRMTPVQGDSVNYESKWATLSFQVR